MGASRIAEGVAGVGVLELHEDHELARAGLRDLGRLGAVGPEEVGDALLAAGPRVHHGRVGLERPGEDAQVVDAPREVVDGGLEDLAAERRVRRRRRGSRPCRRGPSPSPRRLRAGEEPHREVEQLADPDAALRARAPRPGRSFCPAAPAAMPRAISSSESVPPSRYLPSRSSSDSAAASTSAVRSRSASPASSAGTSASGTCRSFPSCRWAFIDDEVHEPGALAARADRELQRDRLHLERGLEVGERLLEVGLLVIEPGDHGDRRPAGIGQHVEGALRPVVRAVGGRDGEHRARRSPAAPTRPR